MDIRATSLCLLSVFTLAVAGCSSNGKAPEEDPNVFPASYKDEILNTLTNLLEDPTNVRNAYISDPVLRAVGKDQRYTVCVRSDSRNANKEYMGAKIALDFSTAGASINWLMRPRNSVAMQPTSRFQNWKNFARRGSVFSSAYIAGLMDIFPRD